MQMVRVRAVNATVVKCFKILDVHCSECRCEMP